MWNSLNHHLMQLVNVDSRDMAKEKIRPLMIVIEGDSCPAEYLASPPRLELGTYCLEGSCSILLSYRDFCINITHE